LNGVALFTYSVLWAISWKTVAASSTESVVSAVESSGSLNQPRVEKADEGRT
jgi:hypothetical protein